MSLSPRWWRTQGYGVTAEEGKRSILKIKPFLLTSEELWTGTTMLVITRWRSKAVSARIIATVCVSIYWKRTKTTPWWRYTKVPPKIITMKCKFSLSLSSHIKCSTSVLTIRVSCVLQSRFLVLFVPARFCSMVPPIFWLGRVGLYTSDYCGQHWIAVWRVCGLP